MLVMLPLLHGKRNPFGAVGTGILCAVMHNLGQLLASWALTGTKAIFGYAPLLLLFALLTGLLPAPYMERSLLLSTGFFPPTSNKL